MKNPFKRNKYPTERTQSDDELWEAAFERKMARYKAMTPEEQEAFTKAAEERLHARIAHDNKKFEKAQLREDAVMMAQLGEFFEEMKSLKGVRVTVKDGGEWIVLDDWSITTHNSKLNEKLRDIEVIKKAVAIIEDSKAKKEFLQEEAQAIEAKAVFVTEVENAIKQKARRLLNQLRIDDKKVRKWLSDEILEEMLNHFDNFLEGV